MRVLVIGARGWVGRHLVQQLAATDDVVPLDGQVVAGCGELAECLAAAAEDCDVVVNAAGAVSGTAERLIAGNLDVTRAALRAAAVARARFVHVGSAAEYGASSPRRRPTSLAPTSPYGWSKALATRLVLEAREAGADVAVVRPFNIVAADVPRGPLLDVRRHALSAASGDLLRLHDAGMVRDYVTVELLGATVRRLMGPDVPAVLDVCSGVGVALGDVLVAACRLLGKDVEVGSTGRADLREVIGDATEMRRLSLVEAQGADAVAGRLLADVLG